MAGGRGHGAGTQPGSFPPVRPPEAAQAPAAAAGRGSPPRAGAGREGGTWRLQPSWAWSVGGLAGLTPQEPRAECEAQLPAEPRGRPCVTGNRRGGWAGSTGLPQQHSCLWTARATARGPGGGGGHGGRAHPTSSPCCPALRGFWAREPLGAKAGVLGENGGLWRTSSTAVWKDRPGPPERPLPAPRP